MSPARYQVRRERGFMDAGWLRARFSFSFGGYVHPEGDRFGPVVALNEDEVQPGTGFPMHPHRDLEIFMIPQQGAIAHEDSLGNRCTVNVGEVLMMRAGAGIRHSQFNASDAELDRHLQLWIAPDESSLPPGVQLAEVGAVPCGQWHLLAAPQEEAASFALAQQARVRIGAACTGRPLPLSLAPGDAAYLHVMHGDCAVHFEDGRTERLAGGEALALEALPEAATLRAEGARAEFLLVTFSASLLLRNRTSADVRAGR